MQLTRWGLLAGIEAGTFGFGGLSLAEASPEFHYCTHATDGDTDDEVFVELWRDGAPIGLCKNTEDSLESLESSTVARLPLNVVLAGASAEGAGPLSWGSA